MEEPPAKRPRRETDLKDVTSSRSPRPHDSRSSRYEDDGRSTNGYNRRYRDDEDRKPRRSRSPAREKHDPNATGGRRRERSREGDRDRDPSYRNNRYRDRDRDRDRGSRRTDREDEKDKPILDRKRRRSRSLSHSRSRSRTPPLGTRVNGANNNNVASTSSPAGGAGPGASNRPGVGKRTRSPPRGPSGARTDHDRERGRQQRAIKKEEGGARAGVNGIVDIKMHEDEDEDAYMKRIMGFEKFRSTKNTKVPGNQIYAVRKEKKTEYRQYMNRVGGFNRPLSPSR